MDAITIIAVVLVVALCYEVYRLRRDNSNMVNTQVYNKQLELANKELQSDLLDAQDFLGNEREKNRTLLSQKKSSETRLGQISEHLVPFLSECKHDPKTMHFLGNPIDYVVFDFDQGSITFLEVKSGNSKPSKRQKTVKNIVKSGRIYYDEIRINEKGVKNRTVGYEGDKAQVHLPQLNSATNFNTVVEDEDGEN